MSPLDEDKLTRILVKVEGTKEAVDNLKDSVVEIKDQLKDTVKKPECRERHNTVNTGMTAITASITEIRDDVKHIRRVGATSEVSKAKKPTSETDRAERSRKTATFYIGFAVGLLALFGGVYKVAAYFASIDSALASTAQVIKKELKGKPKVIYVRVPAHLDSGVLDDPE